jgi:hypothetical protein
MKVSVLLQLALSKRPLHRPLSTPIPAPVGHLLSLLPPLVLFHSEYCHYQVVLNSGALIQHQQICSIVLVIAISANLALCTYTPPNSFNLHKGRDTEWHCNPLSICTLDAGHRLHRIEPVHIHTPHNPFFSDI